MSGGIRVAILLDHIESAYQVQMVESAVRAAHRRGARVVILPGGALTASGTPGRSRGFLYDFLRTADVHALLVMGGTLSNYCGIEAFDRWLRTLPRIPKVVVGLESPSAPSVAVDNKKGIEALVDHLVEKHGRRHIAFVKGPEESYESEMRLAAYLSAVERHGLGLGDTYTVPGGLAREQGIDAVTYLLEDRRLTAATLDAIVAVNDETALGVLEELTRRKISVPGQISVVGFDDTPAAHAASPPLTTVSQRVYEQGGAAMSHLIDAVIADRPLANKTVRPEIVFRESCGCHSVMLSDTKLEDIPTGGPERAEAVLRERMDEIVVRLNQTAHGRLRGGAAWEQRLVESTIEHLKSGRLRLVRDIEDLARRSGQTGIEVCHDILTELRRRAVRCAATDIEARLRLEDLFQECRLALANVASFMERENQMLEALHLRTVMRACLDRAHGAGLPELAVSLEEQLPLLEVRTFIVSRGNEDVLDVVARRGRRGSSTGSPTVTTAALGMDERLAEEEAVVVLPLSADGHQVGLAAMAWGRADPYVYEKLRDLLGMALGVE